MHAVVVAVEQSSAGVQDWFENHESNSQGGSAEPEYLEILQDTKAGPTRRRRPTASAATVSGHDCLLNLSLLIAVLAVTTAVWQPRDMLPTTHGAAAMSQWPLQPGLTVGMLKPYSRLCEVTCRDRPWRGSTQLTTPSLVSTLPYRTTPFLRGSALQHQPWRKPITSTATTATDPAVFIAVVGMVLLVASIVIGHNRQHSFRLNSTRTRNGGCSKTTSLGSSSRKIICQPIWASCPTFTRHDKNASWGRPHSLSDFNDPVWQQDPGKDDEYPAHSKDCTYSMFESLRDPTYLSKIECKYVRAMLCHGAHDWKTYDAAKDKRRKL